MKHTIVAGRVVARPSYAHNVDTGLQVAVFDIVADARRVTVIAREDLAKNVSLSLYCGDAVIVHGWVEQMMGRWRMDAEFVGHDLNVGTTVFNENMGWFAPINEPVNG